MMHILLSILIIQHDLYKRFRHANAQSSVWRAKALFADFRKLKTYFAFFYFIEQITQSITIPDHTNRPVHLLVWLLQH